jgi:hypothetical protein
VTQKTSDAIDVGIRIVREFGFPCFVLAVVGYWGQLAAVALHETVLKPVVESHSTFLKTTSDTLSTLSRSQERQADTLEELAEAQREIREAVTGGQR